MNWLKDIIRNRILKQPTMGNCEKCGELIYLCDTSGKVMTQCDKCTSESLNDDGGFNV